MLRNAKCQSGSVLEESPFVKAVEDWWRSFAPRSMSRGNIAGGLVLLENLRDDFELDVESQKASGSDQLKNATRSNVQKILARFDEDRVLLREGGRTNRGLMKNLASLLDRLSIAALDELSPEDRDVELEKMQLFLVERARDKFNAEKLSFEYRRDTTSRELIGAILESAAKRRKSGDVAEYLVGAKLALRFPNYDIRNSAASAADEQTDERGDFEINDCVFHVTVSPNSGHYDKCQTNLADGFRVFLLVPDRILAGTRQNAELATAGRVSVESIESFVSQNIEELSEFASEKVSHNVRLLLETYNERLSRVESDLSLQIKIPRAMDK
jgi:hypothetical protein